MAIARISLAFSSRDRVGSGAVGAISWTGASLVRGRWPGIGGVGSTRHPSKNINLTRVGFPDQGRSAPQSAQHAPCTILKAGIHMWERVCDQLHTGEAHFCAPSFCYVLRTKKGPLLCHIKSYCFAPISIALRPSRPAWKLASKPAPRCFVLISMVSRSSLDS